MAESTRSSSPSSETSESEESTGSTETTTCSQSSDDCEWQFIGDEGVPDAHNAGLGEHDLDTAPLFTRDGYLYAQKAERVSQYGVLGTVMAIRYRGESEKIDEPRLYMNTNAPFSAIVCGVQGSGKSHTVSVMLENMLIPNFSPIGSLSKPLAGLVLHYGEGGANTLPSEAAWLSSSTLPDVDGVPMCVYVSRSSLKTMKGVYARFGSQVFVEPLSFYSSELDVALFLSLMAIDTSGSVPLYMQIVLTVLRGLGEEFTYSKFTEELKKAKKRFTPHSWLAWNNA